MEVLIKIHFLTLVFQYQYLGLKKGSPSSVKVARQSFSSLLLRVDPGTSFLETVAKGTNTSVKTVGINLRLIIDDIIGTQRKRIVESKHVCVIFVLTHVVSCRNYLMN